MKTKHLFSVSLLFVSVVTTPMSFGYAPPSSCFSIVSNTAFPIDEFFPCLSQWVSKCRRNTGMDQEAICPKYELSSQHEADRCHLSQKNLIALSRSY